MPGPFTKPEPARVRVYLAGGFYRTYKETIRAMLSDRFTFHDPDDGQALPGYYVGQDLDAVRAADLVIAYHDEYPHVYGMAAEVGFAAAVGVPVIYVAERGRVDGFLAALSRATFTNVAAACAFVEERYAPKPPKLRWTWTEAES